MVEEGITEQQTPTDNAPVSHTIDNQTPKNARLNKSDDTSIQQAEGHVTGISAHEPKQGSTRRKDDNNGEQELEKSHKEDAIVTQTVANKSAGSDEKLTTLKANPKKTYGVFGNETTHQNKNNLKSQDEELNAALTALTDPSRSVNEDLPTTETTPINTKN